MLTYRLTPVGDAKVKRERERESQESRVIKSESRVKRERDSGTNAIRHWKVKRERERTFTHRVL